MNKLLIAIIVSAVGLASLQGLGATPLLLPEAAYAGSPPATTTAPTGSARDEQIRALDTNVRNLTDQKTALESTATTLESNPSTAPSAATIRSQIQTLEGQIAGAQQQSNALKAARIKDEYQALIDSAGVQGQGIQEAIRRCGSRANKDILALRLQANAAYILYLTTTSAIRQSEQLGFSSLNNLVIYSFQQGSLALVSSLIRQINRLEQARERVRTFDVSDIFSVNQNTSSGDDVQPRSFFSVANTIANWLITLVSSLAVTTLIIGGFLMIISGGDESRLETGKTIFTYSLIGLVVTLSAFGIISFIQSVFYQ